MRSNSAILTASGLLVLCCLLIIYQFGNDNETEVPATSSPVVRRVVASTSESPIGKPANTFPPSRVTTHQGGPSKQKIAATEHKPTPDFATYDSRQNSVSSIPESHLAKKLADTVGNHELPLHDLSSHSEPSSHAKGIQLAGDVKLPAVVLAINSTEKNPPNTVAEPLTETMQEIVNTFYRDLNGHADRVETGRSLGVTNTQVIAEDIIVIHPGPAEQTAREKANQTYRALFGDSAYNQMTMTAVIEVQIPEEH